MNEYKIYDCLTPEECKLAKTNNVRNVKIKDITIEEMQHLGEVIADQRLKLTVEFFHNLITVRHEQNHQHAS